MRLFRVPRLLTDARRGLLGRGWFARSLLALAVVALLAPALTAFDSDLAAWSLAHGHVYEGRVPVPHAHPWDTDRSDAGEETASGVTFTWNAGSVIAAALVPTTLALGTTIVRTLPGIPLALTGPAPAFPRIPTPPPRALAS